MKTSRRIAVAMALTFAVAPVVGRASPASEGFIAEEERLRTAAVAGDEAAVVALAEFYAAQELWIEALAALKRVDKDPSPAAIRLAAECDYRIGRYRAVVARLDSRKDWTALLAMALTRLGAYTRAAALFPKTRARAVPAALRGDYALAKAEALAEIGDEMAARAALKEAGEGVATVRASFVLSKIETSRGEKAKANAALRAAAAGPTDDWSMRARLAIALADRDISAIEALSLQWRGGAFERDAERALGALRLAGADYDRGFAALRRIVDRSPEADAAVEAQDLIAGALPKLFAATSDLDPKDAARLFFENVEFAPPGRDGDALIKEAAMKLEALGLYTQAARLIDHQTFKRLRGAERSVSAADLARLHLSAKAPGEALRVLRSTRIAGLAPEVVKRRRLLEAEALAANGEADDALALLAAAPTREELALRAEINWSRRQWAAAASDYASVVSAASSLDARERTAAVRAATAYLLADDRAGYRAFASEALNRLAGAPEADLIATLGDVDREQFLADFISDYRSVFSEDES